MSSSSNDNSLPAFEGITRSVATTSEDLDFGLFKCAAEWKLSYSACLQGADESTVSDVSRDEICYICTNTFINRFTSSFETQP